MANPSLTEIEKIFEASATEKEKRTLADNVSASPLLIDYMKSKGHVLPESIMEFQETIKACYLFGWYEVFRMNKERNENE